MIEDRFVERITEKLSVAREHVRNAVELFDSGATLPFVAHYRKDATGDMGEAKLEAVLDANLYYTALSNRKASILENIEKESALTAQLREAIEQCEDKITLEDLYRPFRKKHPTQASTAVQQGLEPLAEFVNEQQPGEQPLEEHAATFVAPEKHLENVDRVLQGVRHILAEAYAEDASLRAAVRAYMLSTGKITTAATKNVEGRKTKFEAYYKFEEPLATIPSHRFLAICRGAKEGMLHLEVRMDDDELCARLVESLVKEPESDFAPQIRLAFEEAYKRFLRPDIEKEVMESTHERADEDAIRVFRENARNLLLAPPAGQLVVMGIDPALKPVCNLAVVDKDGVFVESAALALYGEAVQSEQNEKAFLELLGKHHVEAVAIGNGSGSRDVSRFVSAALKKVDAEVLSVFVNEAGVSIYASSPVARQELPDLDIAVRGAVSIARRLRDPLTELVKIDPRHIGVGQYQHDVNQKQLREGLARTVDSCVNTVGVNLQTAPAALLEHVSGIVPKTAENIVAQRADKGGFSSREQLRDVPGVGPRVFEHCVGFLRLPGAVEPLDATAIHPEHYEVVCRMAESLGVAPTDLIGNAELLEKIDPAQFETESAGPCALADIKAELAHPNRDPRIEFRAPRFLEGIESLDDLVEEMEVEGVITNVTDFGAFIDIGVEQDGLVHLSELSHRYIHDPREVVKVGDIVKVKILSIDRERPRISLSMKALDPGRKQSSKHRRPRRKSSDEKQDERSTKPRRKRRSPKPTVEKKARESVPDSVGKERMNTALADQLEALKNKFNQ